MTNPADSLIQKTNSKLTPELTNALFRKLDFCLEHAPADEDCVIPIGGTLESLRQDIAMVCERAAFDRQAMATLLDRSDKELKKLFRINAMLEAEMSAMRKMILAGDGETDDYRQTPEECP